MFDLPACARFDSDSDGRKDGYSFGYRPRAERGDTRLTIPSLGLAQCPVSRDAVLLIPPRVRVQGEWTNAAGRTARFIFSPPFLESIARQENVPLSRLQRPSYPSFSIDQRLEALCRLLMEETENNCRLGLHYFEALARALAVSVISRIREQDGRLASQVPPVIARTVQQLEENYASDLCLAELAGQAQLSRYQFARIFQKATGYTPHQYLLRVRLSRARALLTQKDQTMSLAEVAAACGFFDQTHFGRHFRRFFGTTPGAFLRAQERTKPQQTSYTVREALG